MAQRRIYPLGVQHFPTLREEGRVYVDKTAHVYRMTRPGMNPDIDLLSESLGKSREETIKDWKIMS